MWIGILSECNPVWVKCGSNSHETYSNKENSRHSGCRHDGNCGESGLLDDVLQDAGRAAVFASRVREARRRRVRDDQGRTIDCRRVQNAGLVPEDARRRADVRTIARNDIIRVRRSVMTIEEMLTAKEGENFEFKTAENRFSYTELQKYACAISNEGGGKIVFGITDKRPRQIKGSKAFDQPERTRKGLIDSLN